MSTVYVLNKDGKPLMPTTRGGHVRHLLKEQKARVVQSNPFTIQLLYKTNRERPEGWLTPTANQLLQTHVNLVKKVQKLLPISDVVLEVNKFAFMRLDNPDIQKWQYQQGPLYKKESLESAVSEMQEHHCLFCKKAD